MPANYIEVPLRRILLVLILLATAGCSIGQQSSAPVTSPSAATLSPSPSPPSPTALWVLSPIGLKLRDQPTTSGKELATIPQGAKLTASAQKAGDPPWYQVTYSGSSGWVAGKIPQSSPPIDLVTTHPVLSFSSTGNGYYFLYPASWLVSDKGVAVEVDGPAPGTDTSRAPAVSPLPGAQPVPKLLINQAADLTALPATPTAPGANLDTTQVDLGGFTVLQRTYQLNGGGYEADIKVKWAAGKALLITFRAPAQNDINTTFHEIVESFGFSIPPSPAP
jgi:hypothetical protein